MQIGWKESEMRFVRFGKFADLFEQYQMHHNMVMEKKIYTLPEPVVSVFDI